MDQPLPLLPHRDPKLPQLLHSTPETRSAVRFVVAARIGDLRDGRRDTVLPNNVDVQLTGAEHRSAAAQLAVADIAVAVAMIPLGVDNLPIGGEDPGVGVVRAVGGQDRGQVGFGLLTQNPTVRESCQDPNAVQLARPV